MRCYLLLLSPSVFPDPLVQLQVHQPLLVLLWLSFSTFTSSFFFFGRSLCYLIFNKFSLVDHSVSNLLQNQFIHSNFLELQSSLAYCGLKIYQIIFEIPQDFNLFVVSIFFSQYCICTNFLLSFLVSFQWIKVILIILSFNKLLN